jgi:hypothetical protein
LNGLLSLSSKGSSTGDAQITGLPFPIANYGSVSFWYNRITFSNVFQAHLSAATSVINLQEITTSGVVTNLTNADFADNSEIMISATYFV